MKATFISQVGHLLSLFALSAFSRRALSSASRLAMSWVKKRATERNVLIEERSYRNKLTIPSMIRFDHHLWSDDATIGSQRIFVGVVDQLVAGLGNGLYNPPRNVKVTTVVINIMLMTMIIPGNKVGSDAH